MKKILRILGLSIIIIAIISAIIVSMSIKPSNSDRIWDEQTTVGDINAKNYFIIYSDILCPYCVAFENAIFENEESFEKYLKENDILVEVRLSDFLYEYGESRPINSRYSAEATYCAKKENRFWDYYKTAITTVWNDFFKDLGKTAFTQMNRLDKNYWIELGKQIGLSEDFEKCVNNDDALEEIVAKTQKTAKLINGLPYFKFNSYVSSGFSLSWGWEYVLMYFKAGLDSQS